MPGMISRVLYKNTVGCSDPDECFKICGSRNGCSNSAYPMLIMNLMPVGKLAVKVCIVLNYLLFFFLFSI